MKANETSFQPMIEGTKQYVVPLFQRPYSWEKREWQILWDDLVELYENSEYQSHFIGSIVTIQIPSSDGISKYLLIDGQQRLTTLFVILILLRDLSLQKGNENLATEINETLIVNRFKKEMDHLKLLPTQWDRESFQNLVLGTAPLSNDRLGDCYRFYKKQFFSNKNKITVENIKTIIANHLDIVNIILDQNENAYLVFESLNAKGKELSQSDLIRNYFFMRINVNEHATIHSTYWEPMQRDLGDNLTDFIRHYLMRTGGSVNKNAVYYTLKLKVDEQNPVDALEHLHRFANYYHKLISPENESDLSIRYYLHRLIYLKQTTCYPFLLNCYEDYYKGILSNNDFIETLSIIENFIIRHYICNRSSNEMKNFFPSLYNQARNSHSFVQGIKTDIIRRNYYPSDEEFRESLLRTDLGGNAERNSKTKFILGSIESIESGLPFSDFDVAEIVYVMPRNLTDWWKSNLGKNIDSTIQYTHKLGNLTLFTGNNLSDCTSYTELRRELSFSKLGINKYFLNISSWRSYEIDNRSQYLADIALKIWSYFGETSQKTRTTSQTRLSLNFEREPHTLTILEQKYKVTSWTDILIRTLNTISEIDAQGFQSLFEDNRHYLSISPNHHFRRPYQLTNRYYIETDYSSKAIYRICQDALRAIDLNSEDWSVDTD